MPRLTINSADEEAKLLLAVIKHSGQTVKFEEVGKETGRTASAIRSHIKALRKKFRDVAPGDSPTSKKRGRKDDDDGNVKTPAKKKPNASAKKSKVAEKEGDTNADAPIKTAAAKVTTAINQSADEDAEKDEEDDDDEEEAYAAIKEEFGI